MIGSMKERSAQLAVEIIVPNLTSALTFYQLIGFVVERHAGTFVSLRWGDSYLFLAESAAAPVSPRWANIRTIVPNVDEVWKRIIALDVPILRPIGDREYGLRDFVVRDPAGFEVRFASIINCDE